MQTVRALLDPHSDSTVGQKLALNEEVAVGPVRLVAHAIYHGTVVTDS